MTLISNWWTVLTRSYAVWLGQFIGLLGGYMAVLNSNLLDDADKIAWHVAGQLHYIPIVIALLGVFGISTARVVKQDSLPSK